MAIAATVGATIYYTTDGSTPTTSSSVYSSAITVAGYGVTKTIKAICVASGSTSTVGTQIVSIDPSLSVSGSVTTFAGSGSYDALDGTGTNAAFDYPNGITTDGTNLYVAEFSGHRIREINISSKEVTTIAGAPIGSEDTTGDTDATGTNARFSKPSSITTDGTNLYVADYDNNKIRQIVISTGAVTTLAGPAQGTTTLGSDDGTGNAARFYNPIGITTDGINLFVAEFNGNKIRKIVIATGEVTTLAGAPVGSYSAGDTEGTGTSAKFLSPTALTTDGTNLYVADSGNSKIRKVVIATGEVTTIAGPAQGSSATGTTDSTTGTDARFNGPRGITTDGTSLFVSDSANHRIRKIVISTGEVTTIAGPNGTTIATGDTNGSGTAARFFGPRGIIADPTGLYLVENDNYTVRMIN